jgi:hypothetical protein
MVGLGSDQLQLLKHWEIYRRLKGQIVPSRVDGGGLPSMAQIPVPVAKSIIF